MRFDVLTLFPQMFSGVLGSSILGRAGAASAGGSALVDYHLTDIRKFTQDKHHKVDRCRKRSNRPHHVRATRTSALALFQELSKH